MKQAPPMPEPSHHGPARRTPIRPRPRTRLARWSLVLTLTACRPVTPSTAPASLCIDCRPAGAVATTHCTGAITDAAWLTGGWHEAGGTMEEHWISAAGHTMLGVGRTIVDGHTVAFEFMRIEARVDGLVFIGQPAGGPAIEFRRSPCQGDALRFENPTHDFPQSIEYVRTGEHTMIATVEGPGRDGGRVGQNLEFRREPP